MDDCNNPAGRILKVLRVLLAAPQGTSDKLAQALNRSNDWMSIFEGLADLSREYDLLESLIKDSGSDSRKVELYKKVLEDTKQSIKIQSINFGNSHYQMSVLPTAVTGLEFIAVDLPEELAAPPDELASIRKTLEELRDEISGSAELGKSLKMFLLDLIRLMRDGIDRYFIRGGRGVRREFLEMIGALQVHYEDVKEAKEKSPGIWERTKTLMEKIGDIASLSEKVSVGIGYINKAIEHVRG